MRWTTPKNWGRTPGVHTGYAVPVYYKMPVMLLIVKSVKGVVSDRGRVTHSKVC
jgi:hypothetical protein